jgi:NtrC-family two-component system response regulator AlgB
VKILIVDDEEHIRKTTAVALESLGHQPYMAADAESALALLAREPFQVAFVNVRLGGQDDLLPQLLALSPGLSIAVFTAHASLQAAAEAMRRGAADYVEKPFTPEQIRLVLGKIENVRRLQGRVEELEDRLAVAQGPRLFEHSRSPAIQRLKELMEKAAHSETSILLIGEDGTGKSDLAREIHLQSARRDKKFVAVSCSSLTKELLSSELFGHVQGALTGAMREGWGKVSLAEGGTLFLDDVGDLPPEIEPRLLRLLQEKEFERVGEDVVRHADVRIITATHHDLERAVAEGTFREDLYCRLNLVTLRIPPLRERQEDLEPLVNFFVSQVARDCGKPIRGFSESAWSWIRQYRWPGNIRELRNFVERSVLFADGEWLEVTEPGRPVPGAEAPPQASPIQVGAPVTLQELETAHIQRILGSSRTIDAAARTLGIDPATLYRKRKRLNEQKQAV